MPLVQITMMEGRTGEMKGELIKKVTDSIAEAIHVPRGRVRVILNEVSKENIGDGGVQLGKGSP